MCKQMNKFEIEKKIDEIYNYIENRANFHYKYERDKTLGLIRRLKELLL